MAKQKRPKTFYHLGKSWKITYKRAETDGSGNVGITDFHKCRVDVYTGGHSDESIKDTLLHELLHVLLNGPIGAMYHKENFIRADKFEEELICLVTPKCIVLFQENPELVDFLFKGENLTNEKK